MDVGLDETIAKELDQHRIKSNDMADIINLLDSKEKKQEFLSYMISNRNELINVSVLLYKVKLLVNK